MTTSLEQRTERDMRLTAEEMDERRHEHTAYEYLCHLQETKVWMESCLNDELPPSTELEEALRNGVYLAKLGHRYTPAIVPLKKIYDADQKRYKAVGLTFRHTDNINYWIASMKELGLPPIFYPETTDLYDKKNCPRVVYCLHALSLYLFRLGAAPQMQDLYGKATFTSEEISAMSEELRKYGLPMPQFRKIGGLLASELPVDEAALHAAILAINDAISSQSKDLRTALQNPQAHLQHIDPTAIKLYQEVLSQALEEKRESAQNRSLSDSYVPDIYDELLTQAEIQGHLKACNVYSILQHITLAVKQSDAEKLMELLRKPTLNLKEVDPNCQEEYCACFNRELSALIEYKLDRSALQQLINESNAKAKCKQERHELLSQLNQALKVGSANDTLRILGHFPTQDVGPIMDLAASLYHEVMKELQRETQQDFTFQEVCSGVRVMTQVAEVNLAVDQNNDAQLWKTLSFPSLHIQGLEYDHLAHYLNHLKQERRSKVSMGAVCPLLTHGDLQEAVDVVNHQIEVDEERLAVLHAINEAVIHSRAQELLRLLSQPVLALQNLDPTLAPLYLRLLIILKKAKMRMMGEEVDLWLEDIKEMMGAADKHFQEALQACETLAAVHNSALRNDPEALAEALQAPCLRLPKLPAVLAAQARERIAADIPRTTNRDVWVGHRLLQGLPVFLNITEQTVAWQQPEKYRKRTLDRQDLEDIILELMSEVDPSQQLSRLEPMLVKLQALCRGFLCRDRVTAKMEHWQSCEKQIIAIQAWWKGILQRRAYLLELKEARQTIVIETRVTVVQKSHKVPLLDYFQQYVHEVVVLQRAWRRWKARQQLKSLHDPNHPSVKVIRKFLHLLDLDADDLEEEIRVQDLRGAVVQTIRRNQELEKDLNAMDIKIGLLVRNQITLKDVVAHGHKLKRQAGMKEDRGNTLNRSKNEKEPGRLSIGLLAMTKAGREKLESYQHLFYLLQTKPVYLAKLVFCLPASKTTKFLERAVLTLYNYGSNLREEYLLLKLFRTALSEEIRMRVNSLSDLASGNPLVIKLIVNYNRNGHGLALLRNMLGPLVKRVIEERDLYINTNPVEVYKAWINQMESETGKPSGMPYEVTMSEALEQPEVKRRLAHSILVLQKLTRTFLESITSSIHQLPYGMLYMARVLAEALREKFSPCPEKDVLKTVGHLLYYRFINSAIVAPDAFDIVQMEADKGLTDDQRRNLGNIAKMLQFAASKKGFGDESPHLMCLNSFIIECHEVFKGFFRACTEVAEPEEEFGMDEYTEATLITKPSIYISIQELCDTHQLLVDFEESVAPDPHDPLRSILEDLGGRPTLGDLLGEDVPEMELQDLAQTEIVLSLTNKFQLSSEDLQAKASLLFATTKQLLIRLITCSSANTVAGILSEPVTAQQQKEYGSLVSRLAEHDRTVLENPTFLSRQPSFLRDYKMPLEELKRKVWKNLCQLEDEGRVTRHNDYLALLQHIATDILHWRKHRQIRAQELHRLLLTNQSLNEKTEFFQAQVESYHVYLQACLNNLGGTSSRKRSFGTLPGGPGGKRAVPTLARPKGVLRYGAIKLQTKGVLLEIEGMDQSRYKSVLFEITPAQENGRFNVTVQLMGLNLTTVEIDIQNLLQLQYEGVAVFNLCGRAKVNVNLLLYLLQTKFYTKK